MKGNAEGSRGTRPRIQGPRRGIPQLHRVPRRTGAPERIKEVAPDAKLIYAVRDPVTRAVSQYQHHVATLNERRSLPDALREDLKDPDSLYICPGFYALQLERYLQHFPQERILVVDQADLLSNRQATLREIFAFLSVDDSFVSTGFEEEVLTAKDHRTYSKFVVMLAWLRTTPLLKLPRGMRVFMRRSLERVVSQPLEASTLDDDLRRQLQELYADDAKRFRELTGKDLPYLECVVNFLAELQLPIKRSQLSADCGGTACFGAESADTGLPHAVRRLDQRERAPLLPQERSRPPLARSSPRTGPTHLYPPQGWI